ncbi:hypothetical protein AC249_AIPGENE9771 [Exaiptasia diaphana]|nr:hypothetical protein AC249_AIPGENE9771 [Exaiptasia diaphana]
MLRIKGSFMSDDGRGIDYASLKNSKLFEEYQSLAHDLQGTAITVLSVEEKMAFFLNVYNALTIHGLAMSSHKDGHLPTSVLEIKQFWRNTAYNIGGYTLSLDDIEHGILRGNKPHPSSPTPLFTKEDPRCELTIKPMDPRIHFALVCGAKSCPPINVYSEKNLENGLNAASKNFCSQEVEIVGNKVILSKIFMWYKQDFAEDDISLLRWISTYLPTDMKTKMGHLIKQMEGNEKVEIEYKGYNWTLNKL